MPFSRPYESKTTASYLLFRALYENNGTHAFATKKNKVLKKILIGVKCHFNCRRFVASFRNLDLERVPKYLRFPRRTQSSTSLTFITLKILCIFFCFCLDHKNQLTVSQSTTTRAKHIDLYNKADVG